MIKVISNYRISVVLDKLTFGQKFGKKKFEIFFTSILKIILYRFFSTLISILNLIV